MRASTVALLLACLAESVAAQVSWHELDLGMAGKLVYAVNLPNGYDAKDTRPVLLALPPGPQTREMVEAGLKRYWGEQARTRGWVVVSPVALKGTSFSNGGERFLAPLLVRIREQFRVAQGRMHLAGASAGGRSAFRVATLYPFEFQTVTVLPGYALDEDGARLKRLHRMRVRMFVGGRDGPWVPRSEATFEKLKALGIRTTLKVLRGEGHVPESLDGDVIMKHLVALHAESAWPRDAAGDVHRALDDFNDAAAKADEDRYFGRFAPEGVFLGTDATERWTLSQFKDFAWPYFTKKASAWIYIPQERHVQLAPGGDCAWFDERVGNASYGECRGTGALRLIDGRWRVCQYNLTVPVPNDLMGGVVRQIREFEDGKKPGSTTVILVRHAEKDTTPGLKDPALTEVGETRARRLAGLLRAAGVGRIYSSEFRRTKDTVAPLAAKLGKKPEIVPARDLSGLVRRLREDHRGETVLVSGHSNTLPDIIKALGIAKPPRIDDSDYDGLYVVTLGQDGPRLLKLQF